MKPLIQPFKTPLIGSICSLVLLLVAAPALGQNFGGAVAISENEVIVGETSNQSSSGTIHVYRRSANGEWAETASLSASDADGNDDRFGRVIAVDGNTLIVGATTKDARKGAGYIFERDASGMWNEALKLSPSDLVEGDHLGRSVAIHGDVAVIGSAGRNESTGVVYVYRRNASGLWAEEAQLTGSDSEPGDYFGLAVAAHGGVVLVGAPFKTSGTGTVYAFRYDEATGSWQEEGKLESQLLDENAQFGYALALSEGGALVGSPGFEQNIGAAFAFRYDEEASSWQQQSVLLPYDGDQGRLGTSVAIQGDNAWVGAPFAEGFTGAIYRYESTPNGTWASATKMLGIDVQQSAQYAVAIAVRGGVAVVGAAGDDYGEGSVRILEQRGQAWQQVASMIDEATSMASITGGQVNCEGGSAFDFGCDHVDMVSFLSLKDIGGERGIRANDVWGWTDAQSGKEYALVGRMDGTAFIDMSDPYNPIYLGNLPLTEGATPNAWRDIKVYKDHAFIVADGAGPHGMQVFDLTQLRNVPNAPATFTEAAHYDRIHSAHNIVINEDTGFAYAVGSSMGGETCGGGLHMIDIREPEHPTFAGCFADTETGNSGTGYSHDAMCITYHGPDTEHSGKEICFGSNENALSIADVTDKKNTVALSRASYPNVGYTHQGWITDDHRYFYVNDELDELQGNVEGTRTLIWDVTDLDDPQLVKEYVSDNHSSDHNLYIRGHYMYQSNYTSGLRILDIRDPENPVEVGFFDPVTTSEDAPGFDGSWSNYPYFKSGVIVVTSIREGVFFLKHREVDI